jgi:hypothetical protein
MSGATPPFSPCMFIAWSLIKDRSVFDFYLYFVLCILKIAYIDE